MLHQQVDFHHGQTAGTLRYLAPEVRLAQSPGPALSQGVLTYFSSTKRCGAAQVLLEEVAALPETIAGRSQLASVAIISEAVDTYAFGCLLYELFHIGTGSGRRIFNPDTGEALTSESATSTLLSSGPLILPTTVSAVFGPQELLQSWTSGHTMQAWWGDSVLLNPRGLEELNAFRRTTPTFKLGILPHIPRQLGDVILSCTDYQPSARPSFQQLRKELNKLNGINISSSDDSSSGGQSTNRTERFSPPTSSPASTSIGVDAAELSCRGEPPGTPNRRRSKVVPEDEGFSASALSSTPEVKQMRTPLKPARPQPASLSRINLGRCLSPEEPSGAEGVTLSFPDVDEPSRPELGSEGPADRSAIFYSVVRQPPHGGRGASTVSRAVPT